MLRCFVDGHQAEWQSLIPLFEFAINDSMSALGHGNTAFYADRGQHPRRPFMTPRTISDDNGQYGGALAQHMSLVTGEVRGLMLESQLARKA